MGLTRQPFNSNKGLAYSPQRAGTENSLTNTRATERRARQEGNNKYTQQHSEKKISKGHGGMKRTARRKERRKAMDESNYHKHYNIHIKYIQCTAAKQKELERGKIRRAK